MSEEITLSWEECVNIIHGDTCEACGKPKQDGHAFCNKCYRSLPKNMQQALWKKVGEGFEKAYLDALNWLT